MCGIAGFCDFGIDYKEAEPVWFAVLEQMNRIQKHRGPDEEGICLYRHCGMAHVRLSILDLHMGHQPMSMGIGDHSYTIVYNGEIYNMPELKDEMMADGMIFHTTSDTEVILAGYVKYGKKFVEKLNGIFAFAIWDERKQKLLLVRDRAGVKPLFFSKLGDSFLFSSEIKGILQYPGMKATVDHEGLCEVFGLGPAKTPGKGVFKDIHEVLPGQCLEIAQEGITDFFTGSCQADHMRTPMLKR